MQVNKTTFIYLLLLMSFSNVTNCVVFIWSVYYYYYYYWWWWTD